MDHAERPLCPLQKCIDRPRAPEFDEWCELYQAGQSFPVDSLCSHPLTRCLIDLLMREKWKITNVNPLFAFQYSGVTILPFTGSNHPRHDAARMYSDSHVNVQIISLSSNISNVPNHSQSQIYTALGVIWIMLGHSGHTVIAIAQEFNPKDVELLEEGTQRLACWRSCRVENGDWSTSEAWSNLTKSSWRTSTKVLTGNCVVI